MLASYCMRIITRIVNAWVQCDLVISYTVFFFALGLIFISSREFWREYGIILDYECLGMVFSKVNICEYINMPVNKVFESYIFGMCISCHLQALYKQNKNIDSREAKCSLMRN